MDSLPRLALPMAEVKTEQNGVATLEDSTEIGLLS